jgi:hypothetical protein
VSGFIPHGQAGSYHVDAEVDQVLNPGVALRILLENFADYGDRILVDTQENWRERLSLLEDEPVVAERMGCFQESFYPLCRY